MRVLRTLTLLFVSLAMFAAVASVASAQSLADIAKKEKKRRDTNQSESKTVITDRDLTQSYGGLPATRPTSTGTEGESSDADAEQDEGEPEDETKTAEYWQTRVSGAKEKISKIETELNEADWGEGQGLGVDPMGPNNLGRRQQAEQELQAARAELEAIRAEGRRAGVPPGWVR